MSIIDHNNITLILGPPGTGKTTRLIEQVRASLASGIAPEQIGFVSFTRKAANEAKSRALAAFDQFDFDQFEHFRTLHSLAYHWLGMSQDCTFSYEHCIALGRSLGLFLTARGRDFQRADRDSMASQHKGDMMLAVDNTMRACELTLNEAWRRYGDDRTSRKELEWFIASYRRYKQEKGLRDFTDMVVDFSQSDCGKPDLRVLIVDEAQDLSRAQWRMVNRLAQGAESVYIAGDDDQAIYAWAGADVQTFLLLPARQREVLQKSHRLPSSIYAVAQSISSRIVERYDKQWGHNGKRGACKADQRLEDVPLDKGEWLLLVRNRRFIETLTEYLLLQGFPFTAPGDSPLESTALAAVRTWEELRKGKSATLARVQSVYSMLPLGPGGVRRGHKMLTGHDMTKRVTMETLKQEHGLDTDEHWSKALTRIPEDLAAHFKAALRRGETLRSPRIHVNTIHSVKGGEADNVLLCPDITRLTRRTLDEQPDHEHRVWYVGASRARKSLHILRPAVDHYTI